MAEVEVPQSRVGSWRYARELLREGDRSRVGDVVKTVYLCGGINGLSDADCRDWREQAKAALPGWRCLDPLRRDYRGRELEVVADIVSNDLDDIEQSNVILANVCRPSWGTAMEIRHSYVTGRPVIGFGANGQPGPWLVFHCWRLVPDLATALALVRDL